MKKYIFLLLVVGACLSIYLYVYKPTPNPIVQPHGIYALIGWNEEPDENLWKSPFVDGMVIRTYWKNLEPAKGNYQWNYLDAQFVKAKQFHKSIRLMIVPGFESPDWVLSEVPTALFPLPSRTERKKQRQNDELFSLPIPWDERYLSLWFTLISRVAARYGNNPAFTYISVTGPNDHNGEVSLSPDRERWLSLMSCASCSENQRIDELKNKLIAAWEKTIDHFAQVFPNKHITLAFITKSFPIEGNPTREDTYKQTLVTYGASHYPTLFGIQTNGLDGRPVCPSGDAPLRHWSLIKDYSTKILTGFQTQAPGNLYIKNCADGDVVTFRQTVQNAIDFGAHFLEVYPNDILDPSKGEVLRFAHEQLNK